MRKTISIILAIVLVLCTTLGTIGCSGCSGCGSQSHEHKYSVKNVDEAYLNSVATCTAKATYFFSCSCGEKGEETFENGSALEHSYTRKTVSPNCTQKGYSVYTCSVCGHAYAEPNSEALGHTVDGSGMCSRCGEIFEHTHEYKEQNLAPEYLKSSATCTSATTYYYSCACGEAGTEVFEVGSALGHNYIPVVTAPTCTEKGYTTYTCHGCNDHYIDSHVEAVGHNYASTVTAPTCTKQGFTTHTCSSCNGSYIDSYVDATGHTNNGSGICAKCGAVMTEHFHSYSEKNTSPEYLKSAATCTNKAVYYYSCACGAKDAKTFEDASLGHDYASAVTEPTCTERGYTTYSCTRCSFSYVGSYVNATGHKDNGSYVCSACGKTLTHTHAYEEKNTSSTYIKMEATCTTKAVYYYSCTCGARGTATFESSAEPGHNYVSTVTAPTCTARGYTTHICSVCNDSFVDTYTDATGHIDNGAGVCSKCGVNTSTHTHNYSEKNTDAAYLSTPATCTTKPEYYYSCSCGAKGTTTFVSGGVLDHAYASVITESTCTAQGYTTHTCSRCGDSYKDSYTAAIDHVDAGSGVCTMCGTGMEHKHVYNVQNTALQNRVSAATCTSPAVYYYTCSCGLRSERTFEYGNVDLTKHTGPEEVTYEYGNVDLTKHTGPEEVTYEYVDGSQHLKICVCTACGLTTASTLRTHSPSASNPYVCKRCGGEIE